jgi:hypothetical protein
MQFVIDVFAIFGAVVFVGLATTVGFGMWTVEKIEPPKSVEVRADKVADIKSARKPRVKK